MARSPLIETEMPNSSPPCLSLARITSYNVCYTKLLRFGYSVSISGDRAIVGADREDTGGDNAGAAYVFERDAGGTWNEVQKLQASDIEAEDFFGESVSISGDRALVGAWGEDTGGGS